MRPENLKNLSKEDLYELAREYEVKGRTEMSKEELVEALSKVIFDEGQTQIEAEIFDLGAPVIGIGASDKKLPSSLDMVDSGRESYTKHEVHRTSSPYFDGDPLPERYNENKIVLMPKNPQWAYAYWEITDGRLEEIKQQFGADSVEKGKRTIRVYDVSLKDFDGTNANSYFDIEVDGDVSDWFIGGLNPTAAYVADIGLKTPHGSFITIARSDNMETPSDSVSTNVDEEWMLVEEYFKKIMERSASGRIVDGKWIGGMGASGAMLGASEEMVGRMFKRLLLQKGLKREKILANLEKVMAAGSLEMGSLTAGSLSVGSLSTGSLSAGSLSVGSLSLAQGEKEKIPGEIPEKEFWLKVGTELILYGATEHDAKVSVMGKEIKLRPDGTFSFRYALPNGEYELPVVATSNDGTDTRSITPTVKRNEK